MSTITMIGKSEIEKQIAKINEIQINNEIDKIERINNSIKEAIQNIPAVDEVCAKINETNKKAENFQKEIIAVCDKLKTIITESEIVS